MHARWLFSHVQLLVTLWTVARQAPLSIKFSRQEYWSGLPCPPPGDLPHAGIKFTSPFSPALADRFFTTSATWEAPGPPEKQTVSRYNLFLKHAPNPLVLSWPTRCQIQRWGHHEHSLWNSRDATNHLKQLCCVPLSPVGINSLRLQQWPDLKDP